MANFAYLSEGERELLRRLSFPVALPTSLPTGWRSLALELYEDVENDEYSIDASFEGPDRIRWSVVSTPGGIGDALPGDEEASFYLLQHPVYGQILVHQFVEDGRPEVLSDWFPEVEDAAAYHSFRGDQPSETDLSALVGSLADFSAN